MLFTFCGISATCSSLCLLPWSTWNYYNPNPQVPIRLGAWLQIVIVKFLDIGKQSQVRRVVLWIMMSSIAWSSYIVQLCILVAGALGGRFDHEAGNINVLYCFSNIRIILLSDDCLIQVLVRTHHHKIHVQPSVVGPHCGLIPIGMPSGHNTTTGLKLNLSKYMLYWSLSW